MHTFAGVDYSRFNQQAHYKTSYRNIYPLTGAESLRLIARHFVDLPSLPVNVTAFNRFEL